MILDLESSPTFFSGTRLGCDKDSQSLLVHSSLRLEERAPSVDVALLFEAQGLFDKPSSPNGLGWGGSSSISSFSKDEGFLFGRNKSLVPWREQDMGLLAVGKGDVYKPLCMISEDGLVVESLDIQPKDTKKDNLEVCNNERDSGFGSPSRGLSAVESLVNHSF